MASADRLISPVIADPYRAIPGPHLALAERMDLGALVERVRGEFNEMPGLQLTEAQAARLWGVEKAACQRVVEALVDADFLRRTSNGLIARATRAF